MAASKVWAGANTSVCGGGTFRKQAPGHLHTDSAVTDKACGAVEHRFAAGPKILLRPIGLEPAEREINERTPGLDVRLEFGALRLVPARTPKHSRFVQQCAHLYSEHVESRAGYLSDPLV